MIWVYFMRSKIQVFDIFKECNAKVENKSDTKVKILRTNNGTEYNHKVYREICKKTGIFRHYIARKTLQQNEVAERMNKLLQREQGACDCKQVCQRIFEQIMSFINQSLHSSIDFKSLHSSLISRVFIPSLISRFLRHDFLILLIILH